MRQLFLREFHQRRRNEKLTQTAVAKRGHITQSALSNMERDPDYKPQADTFVKAIEGLGIPVSAFFRQLESEVPTGEEKKLLTVTRQTHNPPSNPSEAAYGPPVSPAIIDSQQLEVVIVTAIDRLGDRLSAAVERLATHRAEVAPARAHAAGRRKPHSASHRKTG